MNLRDKSANFRDGMNPEMVCSSVLTSWEITYGGVINRCIVYKSEQDYFIPFLVISFCFVTL